MSWKKIGAASGYVMAGTIATQMLQWIIMASIAHQEGPTTLGFYALAQAIALPLQYLSWLSIRPRYLTLGDDQKVLSDFLFLRLTIPALTFVAALAAVLLVSANRELVYISAFVFAFKYIEGLYDLIYAIMQKRGNARSLAKLAILRAGISGAIFLAAYHATHSLYAAMFLAALQQAGLLLFMRGYFKEDGDVGHQRATDVLRRCYRLTVELFPLGVSLVVMALNTSLPRLLLNSLVGTKELGYIAAIGSFTTLGAIAASSLGQTLLQPLAASIAARAEGAFWRQLLWPMVLVNLMCGLGAILSYVAGSMALQLIYGPSFEGIMPLLVAGALSCGPVYTASIATNGIFAAYMRNALFWIQVSTTAATAVATLALVPLLGMMGVFVASALSGILQIIASVVILRRLWAGFKVDSAGPVPVAT